MDRQGVLDAAQRRPDALAEGDEPALRALLHPGFVWTSHRGQRFDRESYIRSNLLADVRWHSQRLIDPAVTIVGRTALLVCAVSDVVDVGSGSTVYETPKTQVWIDDGEGWRCLAGHTGPLIGHGG